MNNKLGPEYIQSTLYYDEHAIFTSAYQYMLEALRAVDPIPESDKAPEFTDEEIARYYDE